MEVLDQVSTGDKLAKRYGFTPKEAPLAEWPSELQKFVIAEEVKEVAQFVIKKWRTDLLNTNIAYVFKKKASKSGDVVTFGTAKVSNELQKVLHTFDAVIEIGHDTWVDLDLDQKMRLVDHELAHLGINLDGSKVVTNTHPVEEFPEIVKRWGPGNDAQIAFINAYQSFSNDNGGAKNS